MTFMVTPFADGLENLRPCSKVSFWPILLKKSTVVSTAEKYVLEIEIFTLNRGYRAQISRSCAQEKHFQYLIRA